MSQEFKVSISRNSNDMVNLTVRESLSGIEFLDCHLSLDDFARVITGQARIEAIGETRGMENVGKKLVRENRSVLYPNKDINGREFLSAWIKENCQEDGWTIDAYLGSQSSISYSEGGRLLNYSVFKYVEVKEQI